MCYTFFGTSEKFKLFKITNCTTVLGEFYQNCWLPLKNTKCSNNLSLNLLCFGLCIIPAKENSLSTGADEGKAVLCLRKTFLTAGYLFKLCRSLLVSCRKCSVCTCPSEILSFSVGEMLKIKKLSSWSIVFTWQKNIIKNVTKNVIRITVTLTKM